MVVDQANKARLSIHKRVGRTVVEFYYLLQRLDRSVVACLFCNAVAGTKATFPMSRAGLPATKAEYVGSTLALRNYLPSTHKKIGLPG